jgi:hypothetical protein
VQRVYARAGKLVLACLVILGFAAIASLGTGLSAGPQGSAAPSPAEIVAARFPSADASLPIVPATYSTASVMPMEQWELFSPNASYRLVPADPGATPAPVAPAEPSLPEAAQPPAARAATAKPEPPKAPPANAAPRRTASRPGGVLNDAQIASLKQRLNLTAEQEQMWPAVEAALRKVVYTKNAADPQVHAAQSSGGRMAYIDPGSTEVQQLKYAALPLIMRLNDDQRREVKMMAHVMGLEAVASQF